MSFRMPNQIMQHTWAAIVVGVATVGYGAYSKGRANKKQKDALSKRKAYTTQDETYQILNALENKSQGDTQTRDYQTQQIDNAFSQQLGVAELLGADANDLSGMFQQKINGILQVGQQFHASNMEAFGKYIGALDMVAKSKDAEYGSQQNIVKDAIQAAAADGKAADATINSGINTALAGYSSYQSNKLYKDYLQTLNTGGEGVSGDRNGDGSWDANDRPFDKRGLGFDTYELEAAVKSSSVAPQRTTASSQVMNLTPRGSVGGDYTQDAGFLAWLQNNGIGTKR